MSAARGVPEAHRPTTQEHNHRPPAEANTLLTNYVLTEAFGDARDKERVRESEELSHVHLHLFQHANTPKSLDWNLGLLRQHTVYTPSAVWRHTRHYDAVWNRWRGTLIPYFWWTPRLPLVVFPRRQQSEERVQHGGAGMFARKN